MAAASRWCVCCCTDWFASSTSCGAAIASRLRLLRWAPVAARGGASAHHADWPLLLAVVLQRYALCVAVGSAWDEADAAGSASLCLENTTDRSHCQSN